MGVGARKKGPLVYTALAACLLPMALEYGMDELVFILCHAYWFDALRWNMLWGENVLRRFLHHMIRNTYNPAKQPWIRFLPGFLPAEVRQMLMSIQKSTPPTAGIATSGAAPLLSKVFGGHLSQKCSFYYNDFNAEAQQTLDEIGERVKPQLEKLAGVPLTLGTSNFRCCIVRYEGPGSGFAWHYDTEPGCCYRTIIMLHRSGEISPFTFMNDEGEETDHDLATGDGIFFQGTRTYHHVKAQTDPTAIRYIVGWQYCSDPSFVEPKTLCSELRGASSKETLSIMGPVVLGALLTNNVFSMGLIGAPWAMETWQLALVALAASVFVRFVPRFLPSRMGTHVSVAFDMSAAFLVCCFLVTWRPRLALLLYIYYVLSEALLPAKLVEWN